MTLINVCLIRQDVSAPQSTDNRLEFPCLLDVFSLILIQHIQLVLVSLWGELCTHQSCRDLGSGIFSSFFQKLKIVLVDLMN